MRAYLGVVSTVLLLHASHCLAQEMVRKLAAPGPNGVYVNLGRDLPSTTKTSNGIALYRIERRGEDVKNWKIIASVQAPASLEELKTRIAASMELVPPPLRLDTIPAEWIWARMQLGADSLKIYGTLLPVRLALGMAYLDTSTPPVTPLEYRVSHVDAKGTVVASLLSEKVFYPASVRLGKATARGSETTEREVRVQWIYSTEDPPRAFDVHRRENLSGEFARVPVRRSVSKQRDSLQLSVRDTNVQPDRIYQYYVIPMDAYGNTGIPSDTVRVATYNFGAGATATYAYVENLDSAGGLRVRWQLQNPNIVRGITILRSEAWDTGFSALAHLSPSVSEFVDQNVVPMKDYYYYVEAVGPLGEHTRSCATMHGLYESSLPPFPPLHLRAEPVESGVRLTWTNNEEGIKGFYVYRADAAASSFEQVSPFIAAGGTEGSFLDTSKVLSPRFTYAYAVRSENTSHRLSELSDTAYVRPGIKSSPYTPLGLRATVEGLTVQLVWQEMFGSDPSLLGFKVLRRAVSGGRPTEFAELTDSLLPPYHNHFRDTTTSTGKVYEYAVQALDAFGGKSGISTIVRASIASRTPLPPTGVRASQQTNGILLEWDEAAASEETGYRLYRYERGKQPVRIASLTETEFVDTNAQKGRLYFYYVTSTGKGNVESGPSTEISVRR